MRGTQFCSISMKTVRRIFAIPTIREQMATELHGAEVATLVTKNRIVEVSELHVLTLTNSLFALRRIEIC